MRANQEDTNAFNTLLKSGRFSHARKVLNGPDTITLNGPLINFLDANGSTRVVTLPALDRGRFFVVSNVGTTGNLTVQSDVGVTITTLLPSDTALMFAGDLQWAALRGWAALGVFTNTVNGLVPAPNSGVPGSLFLRDDGQWGQVQVTGIVDAFKFITDGTTIATGSGPDTFRLRSSTGKIGITVQNNDVTFGDNANFTVNEASVNHNALLNYVADQHVAHSGVVLNPGTGMSGGGDITASRTLNFNPHSLTVNAAPALTDYAVMDLAAGGPRTTLFSVLNALFIHNNLAGYVANEHINHTGVSIVAGAGISGGGDITTSRTVALDINGLASATPAATDTFPFYNAAATAPKKLTLTALNGLIDHNALLNYVANQHIDHTAVSITAGTGLTGGGTIAATRTLSFATIAANTVLGNVTGGAAVPIALTQTQLTALINAATTTLSGAVPAPGTATGKVLSDALTWVAAGAGNMIGSNNLSEITSPATARSNIGAGYGYRNRLFNTDFLTDLRTHGNALTLTTANLYGPDRWMGLRGTNVSTIQQNLTGGPTLAAGGINIPSFLRVQRTAANTGVGTIQVGQIVESKNMTDLAGRAVVLSFYARSGANYSPTSSLLNAQVRTGTTADQGNAGFFAGTWAGAATPISQNATLTTSWQRFFYTATMGATALETGVVFTMTPVGTAGAADYFDITGAQLESGTAPTDFELLPYGQDLLNCQRYCMRPHTFGVSNNIIAGWGAKTSGTTLDAIVQLPFPMFKGPTLITNSAGWTNGGAPTAGNLSFFGNTTVGYLTATGAVTLSIANPGDTAAVLFRAQAATSWNGTQGESGNFYLGNTANLLFDAEL